MAIANTQVWRVRAGGNNANGGGYDPSVSGVLSTTLNGAIAAGDTTIVVASATGWPSSGNYYARIGNNWESPETFSSGGTGSSEVVLVTAGQGTTSWTVTRAQLGTVAQAFATGVVVDNELSRCNTAIGSGSVGTSTNSTTFTDATAAFNETYIGNVLWIASGAGATVGAYTIQSITSATTVVLDRVSGTYTAGVWKVGGAWADPRTNVTSSANIKSGNIIYIRAGGSGTVASPDYTTSEYITGVSGDATNGLLAFIGENGRPFVKPGNDYFFFNCTNIRRANIYFIANNATYGAMDNSSGVIVNCIYDQNGKNTVAINGASDVINSEVFSSTANGGAAGSAAGVATGNYGCIILNTNIHNCWGNGVILNSISQMSNCIVSNNPGNGVSLTESLGRPHIVGCTIDGNLGHGIVINSATTLSLVTIVGTIISNHNQASKYGIRCNFGSTAANDRIRGFIDNNTFYNNTADALNLTVTSAALNGHVYANNIGVDPGFVAQSTQNYAIGAALQGLGFPQAAFLQSKSGQTPGVRNYMDPGAVQPQATGGTTVINARPTAHLRR